MLSTKDIRKIIKSLANPDRIPLKRTKTTANFIDSHLPYIMNKDLKKNRFLESAKTILARLIYQRNYRSLSLLDAFSKFYENDLHKSLPTFTDKLLYKFF